MLFIFNMIFTQQSSFCSQNIHTNFTIFECLRISSCWHLQWYI